MARRIITAIATLCLSAPLAAQTPAPVPTERDVRELSAFFVQIDADRNGRMTKAEMSAFGIRHGIGTLVKDKVWNAMDANGDGQLTKDEFIRGMVSDRAARRAKMKP